MSRLKEILQKNENLFFIASLVKYAKKRDFRQNVIAINENPREIVVEKRGEECKGVLLCEINPARPTWGFFAVFRRTLAGLYFAENIGAKPYITYADNFIYKEDEPINGTKDPFEYYFEPVKTCGRKEIKHANSVIEFKEKHSKLAEYINTTGHISYKVSEQYLQSMGEILKKYIKTNAYTEKYIQAGLKETGILEQKVLGVHCRGTDFNLGSYNHPIMVTVDDYFRIIDDLMKKNRYKKIFLATDDTRRLEAFKKKYGDKITCYNDVLRTSGNEGVHFSKVEREHHKYRLGLEVVRDVYSLAACDGIVAGMSEVSIGARIIKRSQEEKYIDEIIIDKGVVKKGKGFKHD